LVAFYEMHSRINIGGKWIIINSHGYNACY